MNEETNISKQFKDITIVTKVGNMTPRCLIENT